jgi:hypothetical protein
MFQAERIAGTDFEPNLLIEFLRPPFRKFEFSTPMSPAHAASVLQKIVEPTKTFRWPSTTHRYFEGWVEGDRFKISRIISGRDSFLPIIQGSFRGEGAGTIVRLNMRMVWPVMIFCFGFMLFLFLSVVKGGSLGLIGMLLFMYFMASVCFAIEARIAMNRLLRLLSSVEIRGDTR